MYSNLTREDFHEYTGTTQKGKEIHAKWRFRIGDTNEEKVKNGQDLKLLKIVCRMLNMDVFNSSWGSASHRLWDSSAPSASSLFDLV